MKIALCTGSFAKGGVGSSLRILCAGMQSDGHQCDIVTTSHSRGNDYESGRREGWPIKAVCAGERWLRKRLEITLERLLNYDVVINNHSIETLLIFPSVPKHIVRISVVHSTNNAVISEACLNSCWLDTLVCLTPTAKQMLEDVGIECQIRVISNASRVEGGQFSILGKIFKILYLGRLTDIDKNILILPEIAVACKKRGLDFTITIAGDGPDRSILEEKMAQLGVSDCFTMLGTVPRESVEKLLSASHCLLLPSNYEGLSLALIEAMAAGCVPVISDIPPNRWVLGASARELQAPVKDAATYAERLYTIAANPDQYSSLQERLRRRQRENFTPEVTVRGYLRLIEDLRVHRIEDQFAPVPLASLPMPKHYKRRCMRVWWLLQKCKYVFQDYRNIKITN